MKIIIGIVVGSLREGSFSRVVANYVAKTLPNDYEVKFIDIGSVGLYNQDLDTDSPPASWAKLRKDVGECSGYIFVTPEYNRSVPAVLKNAIDIASRPYGGSKWVGKPGAIISVSPGALGGFGANHHLRQSMTFLDVYIMQQPEMYVGNIVNAIKNNDIIDESVMGFLKSFTVAYIDWIKKFEQ